MTRCSPGPDPRFPTPRFSTGCDMTRYPVRRLLALALASSLSLPAMAQMVGPIDSWYG